MSGASLNGLSVVVTGAGSGIGAACALSAGLEGARVTICGRTDSRLQVTAERIRAQGGQVEVVVADVTVEQDVARLMNAAAAFGEGLHGVVANAGGGGLPAPFHLQDAADFTHILHLNLSSTFLCIKHAVPHLARAGKGSFVGMSSLAGHVTHPYFGAYPAAKAGIESLVRNAADEYGAANIRFNAVQPGFIATELMESIPHGGDIWNSYVSQTPLGGVGQPEDIAQVVRFLLSEESRWMTGQTLAVDGGASLRRGPDFSSSLGRRFDARALDPRTR